MESAQVKTGVTSTSGAENHWRAEGQRTYRGTALPGRWVAPLRGGWRSERSARDWGCIARDDGRPWAEADDSTPMRHQRDRQ